MSTRHQQQTETTAPTFPVPATFATDTNQYRMHPSRETYAAIAAADQQRAVPSLHVVAGTSRGNLIGRRRDQTLDPQVNRLSHTDGRIRDSSGFAVFSDGELGAMHVTAHRMLDSGQIELGHRLLGARLKGRHGTGSDWVHIQWHMAVFELSLGHWQAAWRRFRQQILPSVINSDDALTDAPALLWRLQLKADRQLCLPWEAVRARSLSAIDQQHSPFVRVHNLLALAGAKDLDSLDMWIRNQTSRNASSVEALVARIARALRAYVSGKYHEAAVEFSAALPHVFELGGSRAQNDLFTELRDSARRRAKAEYDPTLQLQAA
ncbi:MAG: hypothetical protein JSU95_01620 [Betaproteobacteria bacterium]|nr:MAG: hypothetical protein JSU95_01620 [Betaproteobacteria bacterium]